MTALVRGVAHHTTPAGPDTDRDQCPTNRRDGYAPTCGHPEADHHDHLRPEENDVSDLAATPEQAVTHDPCCSSHGVPMSCERYRYTHFVEVGPCCAAWDKPYSTAASADDHTGGAA